MSDPGHLDDRADWVFPDFSEQDSAIIKKAGKQSLPTAEDIENIYNEARKEGYENGYKEGLEKGKNETESALASLEQFMQVLQEPYRQISDDVIDTIKHIAVVIAGQIIRREINMDDKNIIAAVKKSLSLIDDIEKPITIHVNPADISTVREYISGLEGNIKFFEDITITRGGCRIDAAKSIIDATIESQITEISAALIGGSRFDDD